jgi:hypothetical protein
MELSWVVVHTSAISKYCMKHANGETSISVCTACAVRALYSTDQCMLLLYTTTAITGGDELSEAADGAVHLCKLPEARSNVH